MRLLIGLGNNGEQYRTTRHNAGFMLLDAVAREIGQTWQQKPEGQVIKMGDMLLCKPSGFINLSGQPIASLIKYYRIDLKDVCIAADDVYLAPGMARIRADGADGGHNGWKSVVQHLGGSEYLRVRLGVGVYEQRPEHRIHQPELSDYVLQPLPHADQKQLADLIDRVVPLLVGWLRGGEVPLVTLSAHDLHI